MKKLILLACFGLFWITGSFAQELDFKISVDSVFVNNNKQYNIIVTVLKGKAPFIFELCDRILVEGGKTILKTEEIFDTKYTFPNISIHQLYIYVYLPKESFGKGKKFNF
jgi:hypothetical protein